MKLEPSNNPIEQTLEMLTNFLRLQRGAAHLHR